MFPSFTLGSFTIPTYSACFVIGFFITGVLALLVTRHRKLELLNVFLMAVAGGAAGFAGARFLAAAEYCIAEPGNMERLSLTIIREAGFSYYGGMLAGFAAVIAIGKKYSMDVRTYMNHLIFLVPVLHMIQKIGCFCAGCCYGIEYHGFGAVVLPENGRALSGVSVFPAQLLEAGFLLALAVIFYRNGKKHTDEYPMAHYIFAYSICRVICEKVRYHAAGELHIGEMIAVISIVLTGIYIISRKKFTREKIHGK